MRSSKNYVIGLIILVYTITLSVPLVLSYAADGRSGLEIGGSFGYNPLSGPAYPIAQDSYFTDDSGNILMYVNILGKVGRTGQIVVRENVDFSTILALCGGINEDANLKNVLVVRQKPDPDGKYVYIVNLKSFYKKGDRSGFIALKPNDTIIIPEKSISLAKISRIISMTYPFVYLSNIFN